jgi:glycosyltransferase involved in cell wall biosynthesis
MAAGTNMIYFKGLFSKHFKSEKRRASGNIELLRQSPLLDPVWYRQTYADLRDSPIDVARHYLEHGAAEGRNPSALFDTKFYLEQNPDVTAAGMNPLIHYILHGAEEGRDPHPLFLAAWYKTQTPDVADNPLLHYITKGRHAGLDPHPLFMSAFYLTEFPDLQKTHIEPLTHYLTSGAISGLNPCPLFDSKWYLETYSDVAAQHMNPLLHYRLTGAADGRNPSAHFSTVKYLKLNPDLSAFGPLTPLGHYLRYGAVEGRKFEGVISPHARSNGSTSSPTPSLIETLSSAEPPNTYKDWCRLNDPGEGIRMAQRRQAAMLRWKPVISLIVPVYRIPVNIIQPMIDSIKTQTYPHWQICLALAWLEDKELTRYLKDEASKDPRIKLRILNQNAGISGNSNAAFELVDGEYIGLLDHDDTLPANALFEMASALNDDSEIDFLYSDKDTMDESGRTRFNPLFKPTWSPELMLSINYLTHFNVMRTSRVREIGGWDPTTDGAQDWDLFLRFIDKHTKVHAVRRPLYHWRIIATSVASGLEAKPWAAEAQLRAVTSYLDRSGWQGASATFAATNMIRVKWNADYRPSILILTVGEKSAPEGEGWAAAQTAQLESNDQISVEYLSIDIHSFGETVNLVVAQSDAAIVIFLDAMCQPNSGWLNELVGPLQSDALAAVGGGLDDTQGKQIEGNWVFFEGRPNSLFREQDQRYWGIFTGPWCCRNQLAVSGGLLAVRRSAWDAVGGFSRNPAWQRYDLDLGIRISAQDHGRIMFNSFARATSSVRSVFNRDASLVSKPSPLFAKLFPDGDPFFHPALTLSDSGLPALRRFPPVHHFDFFEEAKYCASRYDAPLSLFHLESLHVTINEPVRRVAWFIPNFEVAFYGGIHTILRAAEHMRDKHNVHPVFVALGATDTEMLRATIARAFPKLAAECDIIAIQTVEIPSDLVDADAAVATLWVTAYAVLRLKSSVRRFYFVQDYEPLFYPAGTTYSLAEATYKFGFHGICNTQPLQKLYEEHGGKADHFLPAVDTDVFYDQGRVARSRDEPFLLFNYARPGHPRNCFETVAEGLIELKRRMKNRLRIITAGAEWDPKDHGLSGVVEHLGLLSYRQTGQLYRSVDAGIVAMATCHPSYLPFELMACGALVATNRNRHTEWLLKDQENCVLFELTRSAIADKVQSALEDSSRLEKITAQAKRTIAERHSDWDQTCETISNSILGKSNAGFKTNPARQVAAK